MACNHPLKAFLTGSKTLNGKDDYFISRQLGDLCPVSSAVKAGHVVTASAHLKDVNGLAFLTDPVEIPCGRCVGCRLDFARQWSTRCVLEMAYHSYNYFVTLTYNESCCPRWLVKRDLQLFIKRLRQELGYQDNERIRYFACGEYGTENKRPHYHLILFCDKPLVLSFRGPNRFLSSTISKCWTFGFHEVSFAEPGTCAYVAGYVNKKALVDPNEFLEPPFLLMSRRPGIAYQYFADHPDMLESLKVYGHFGDKASFNGIPRYFKNKFGEDWKILQPRLAEKAKRQKALNGSAVGSSDEADIGWSLDAIYKSALESKKRRL